VKAGGDARVPFIGTPLSLHSAALMLVVRQAR
jgi:hypothetical protein